MSLRPRRFAAAAAAVFGVLVLAGPAPAAFVYFTSSAPAAFPPDPYTPPDRTAFDAATTGQSIETFEVAAGFDNTFAGPISAATNTPPFTTGSIIPNLVIDTGPVGGGLFFVNTDILGPTTVLTTNEIADFAVLTFAAPVTAFGVDLTTTDGTSGVYTIRIYAPGGALLDTQTISPPVNPTDTTVVFFGFTSDVPVGRVELDAEILETFDNVTLARAFAPVGVPAPGGLALLLAAGPAGLLLRRRNKS